MARISSECATDFMPGKSLALRDYAGLVIHRFCVFCVVSFKPLTDNQIWQCMSKMNIVRFPKLDSEPKPLDHVCKRLC